jgi:hypothetical protein
MRARNLIPLAALGAVLLTGCGDRNLVLNVDVLSYLDPAVTQFAFGPLPAVPGGLTTGEVAIIQDVRINLIQRPNDLAKVQSVTLSFSAQVKDSTGAGADTLRLYMADDNTDPLTTIPVVVLPVALVDGQSDTVHVDVGGDQRLIDLFNGNTVRLSATNSVRGPSSGPDLNGRLKFTEIRATVIAGRKGL